MESGAPGVSAAKSAGAQPGTLIKAPRGEERRRETSGDAGAILRAALFGPAFAVTSTTPGAVPGGRLLSAGQRGAPSSSQWRQELNRLLAHPVVNGVPFHIGTLTIRPGELLPSHATCPPPVRPVLRPSLSAITEHPEEGGAAGDGGPADGTGVAVAGGKKAVGEGRLSKIL